MSSNNKPCIGAPAHRRVRGHAKGLPWAMRPGAAGHAKPSEPSSNGHSALWCQCLGQPAQTHRPAHPYQQRPAAAQATPWCAQPATAAGPAPHTSHGQRGPNDSSTRLAPCTHQPRGKAVSSDITPARHRRK